MFERGDGRGRWLRALEVTAKRESEGVCEKPKGVNACGDFGRWIRKGLLVVKKRRFERRRASRLVMAIHGEGLTVRVVEELKVDGEMMATVMHVKMEAKRMVAAVRFFWIWE